jgi:hypothetical protein
MGYAKRGKNERSRPNHAMVFVFAISKKLLLLGASEGTQIYYGTKNVE